MGSQLSTQSWVPFLDLTEQSQKVPLYVARVGKDGGFRLSKPCSMCHAAMTYVGIKRVYWTIDDNSCAMGKL